MCVLFQAVLLLHCAIPRARIGGAVFLRTQACAWATFQDSFSTRQVSSAKSSFMAVVVETKTTSKKRGTVRRRVSLVRKIGHYCLLKTEGRKLWLLRPTFYCSIFLSVVLDIASPAETLSLPFFLRDMYRASTSQVSLYFNVICRTKLGLIRVNISAFRI